MWVFEKSAQPCADLSFRNCQRFADALKIGLGREESIVREKYRSEKGEKNTVV